MSAEVVFPGASIFDRVQVLGLGKSARIEVELFGPYATRAAINCSGAPYWRGSVVAHGDGVVRTPPVRLTKAGFYTFRERVARLDGEDGVRRGRGDVARARRSILTGRGDPVARVRAAAGEPARADARARRRRSASTRPSSPSRSACRTARSACRR